MGFKVEEKFRIKTGIMASNSSFGNNGAFKIPLSVRTVWLCAVAELEV